MIDSVQFADKKLSGLVSGNIVLRSVATGYDEAHPWSLITRQLGNRGSMAQRDLCEPIAECYCVILTRRNIPKIIDYCGDQFGECEIFRREYRKKPGAPPLLKVSSGTGRAGGEE